jgi:hypothetical protein
MVFTFNKWRSFSAISLFLMISGGIPHLQPGTPLRKAEKFHPFHVSVVEINHNASDKTLEISCKIFTDDFEKILAKNYNTKADLINPPNKAAMDTLVKKYILSHLAISIDGKPGRFNYLGFEHEEEAVYSYVEAENVTGVKNMNIQSNIMYDLFDDQMNIFHVTVGGERKSSRLVYPDKQVLFSY